MSRSLSGSRFLVSFFGLANVLAGLEEGQPPHQILSLTPRSRYDFFDRATVLITNSASSSQSSGVNSQRVFPQ